MFAFTQFGLPAFANAQWIILAEGNATSTVAEYVVLNEARARLWNNARNQCRQQGYEQEPSLVEGSGQCQAWYQNRIWRAHCYANFDCE